MISNIIGFKVVRWKSLLCFISTFHACHCQPSSPVIETTKSNRAQATESEDDLSEDEEEEVEAYEEDSDRSEPAHGLKYSERRAQPAPRASTSQVYNSDDGDDLSDLSD